VLERLLGLRQPAISQQLARLRADGLVEARRDGKNILFSLARREVREIIGALHRAFCRQPQSHQNMPSCGDMIYGTFDEYQCNERGIIITRSERRT
jgi:hypothetical protein